MSEVKLTNTPYDDVFRTLLNDCSSLVIPLINEIFHENYTGNEKIVFSANEHFLNQQGGNEDERITDSNFKVVGMEIKKYHLECQCNPDSSMLVRLFEYGTQIALDEGEIKKNVLTVTIPNSAVLYLRCNESTPDKLKIRMVTPGGDIEYNIMLMKLQQYALDEIFDKKLLFLIPFYIFSHEKYFEEYEKDASKLEQLKQEYELIKNRLEDLMNQGEINEYTKCTICDMSNKVLEHIAVKYESVKKGVQSVMGGKVLEYEAKTIRNEALEEGMERGIDRGIYALVSTLKDMNVPIQIILEKVQEKFNLSLETAKKYI